MSLFEFKPIDDVGDVGDEKPNQRNAHLAYKPKAVHGRFTPKDDCERQFWNEPFRKLKDRIKDAVHEQLMSTIYKQIVTPIDDTMAEDFIVSCCTKLKQTTQLPMESQMNPNVEKWTSMIELGK